jgi:para-aminobenzoate synthetase component 1
MDAVSAFRRLRAASPAPFSALLKRHGQYTICASPERFLCGWERRVISQPMKGTAPRGATDDEDASMISTLHSSAKERAENVMIVDLVRSDLARSCVQGTVTVDDLFGIHTFPAVHQMVSTVSGRLRDDQTWWDAARHAFPMGSMTGAPKEMVMSLIARYEHAPRGRFSGSIGYVTPDGDFDFNVVIRSLFYDERDGRLWYSTGGAITWASDPEAEWQETLLKGAAIEGLFRGS